MAMPIRWYGPADPDDPTYRHFERVVNLTVHAMVFAAINSGLWFVQEMRHPWQGLQWITGLWLAALVLHLIVVIAQRPKPAADASDSWGSMTADPIPWSSLPAADLQDLQATLADRLFIQISGWHLYLGDADLAGSSRMQCAHRSRCFRRRWQAIEAVKVSLAGGATHLPLARLLPPATS